MEDIVLVNKSYLVNIADAVRGITKTTGELSHTQIKTMLHAPVSDGGCQVDAEVGIQSSKLSELKTILENKAIDESDLITEIDTQANKLSELKTILEGKAGGGGGSTVETCTVTVYGYPSSCEITYMSPDGPVVSGLVTNPFIANDVVCNSLLVCASNSSAIEPATRISGEGEFLCYADAACVVALFRTPTTAGVETTFENYDAD